ncbi:MAG: hypothetical protein GY801_40810, partial [bacterium]|nr:hypothetical protein [bacterium]
MFVSNPYIAGNPVFGQGKLIGRENIVRDVERMLRNPYAHAVVLFGQRRIGKTSVLLHLEQVLLTKQEYLPVYVDLQGNMRISLDEMSYGIAQKIALLTNTTLPERARFDLDGRFFRETFIPAVLNLNKRKGLIVLFDEFDMLDMPLSGHSHSSFFSFLWEWLDEAKGIQCVFVLGHRPEELSNETLSLLKAFRTYRISLLGQEESLSIVRRSEEDGSLKWADEARNWVWYWTRGHPFFTQLLCSEIWELCTDRTEVHPLPVDVDDVEEALEVALERGANQFQWIWESFPAAERLVAAAMASTADEVVTREMLNVILRQHGIHLPARELELAPENLLRWDILRQEEEGFCFAIPLFRLWVSAEKSLDRIRLESDS